MNNALDKRICFSLFFFRFLLLLYHSIDVQRPKTNARKWIKDNPNQICIILHTKIHILWALQNKPRYTNNKIVNHCRLWIVEFAQCHDIFPEETETFFVLSIEIGPVTKANIVKYSSLTIPMQ